ncbi:MAG: hypothetical protein ACETWK_03555 [Candidatus Aminicenantaceae bacterium]
MKSLKALGLAEAGAERGIWELRYGDVSTWEGDDTLRTLAISDFKSSEGNVIGDIEISIIDPVNSISTIESKGRVAGWESSTLIRAVRIIYEHGEGEGLCPFDHAVFANTLVKVHSYCLVDSYDSRLSSYGGENKFANAHIGTNSLMQYMIQILGDSQVDGNAYSGPESDPETVIYVDPFATLNGFKQTLSGFKEMPSAIPPSDLPDRGVLYLDKNSSFRIKESGVYSSIFIDKNASLIVPSDVTIYVTGGFDIETGGFFIVKQDARAKIYLGTYLKQKGGAIVNQTHDPTRLLFIGTETCTDVDIKNGTHFYAAIYTPSATVDIGSYTQMNGAIIGNEVKLSSSVQLHYDEALVNYEMIKGVGNTFNVISWHGM